MIPKEKINILRGNNIDHCEKKNSHEYMSDSE